MGRARSCHYKRIKRAGADRVRRVGAAPAKLGKCEELELAARLSRPAGPLRPLLQVARVARRRGGSAAASACYWPAGRRQGEMGAASAGRRQAAYKSRSKFNLVRSDRLEAAPGGDQCKCQPMAAGSLESQADRAESGERALGAGSPARAPSRRDVSSGFRLADLGCANANAPTAAAAGRHGRSNIHSAGAAPLCGQPMGSLVAGSRRVRQGGRPAEERSSVLE